MAAVRPLSTTFRSTPVPIPAEKDGGTTESLTHGRLTSRRRSGRSVRTLLAQIVHLLEALLDVPLIDRLAACELLGIREAAKALSRLMISETEIISDLSETPSLSRERAQRVSSALIV
ncbi:hypothetical protein OAO87_02695 [bacterium]|nr:hypothetical protein [bacterium]